jgi:Glycosyl transferases group 1
LRVLLIEPGASWSTADVSAGLLYGLDRAAVSVVRYRLDARIERSNRELYSRWRRVKRNRPDIGKPNAADVFFQAGSDALTMALYHGVDAVIAVSAMYLHPAIIRLMKMAGLRVFLLFTESPYDLPAELDLARIVAGCWTNERSSLRAFRGVTPASGYLPHAWHPERHTPIPQPGDERVPAHDVVFVGSAFQERIDWLHRIDWTGIDLGLYGMWEALARKDPLQQYVRGQITDNRVTAALYRRAKITINLYRTSRGWGPAAPQIAYAESLNPRAYELAACGAFHLSTYRAEVPEVFGDLVPTFAHPDEASALIRQWLAQPEERAAIAAQLPACVAEMSWTARAASVVRDLGSILHPRPVAAPLHPHSQADRADAFMAVKRVGSQ